MAGLPACLCGCLQAAKLSRRDFQSDTDWQDYKVRVQWALGREPGSEAMFSLVCLGVEGCAWGVPGVCLMAPLEGCRGAGAPFLWVLQLVPHWTPLRLNHTVKHGPPFHGRRPSRSCMSPDAMRNRSSSSSSEFILQTTGVAPRALEGKLKVRQQQRESQKVKTKLQSQLGKVSRGTVLLAVGCAAASVVSGLLCQDCCHCPNSMLRSMCPTRGRAMRL